MPVLYDFLKAPQLGCQKGQNYTTLLGEIASARKLLETEQSEEEEFEGGLNILDSETLK